LICIDNTAAIPVLNYNPEKVQITYNPCIIGKQPIYCRRSLDTVWTPSHIGIPGNEKADELAKHGSNMKNKKCTLAYTSLAWMNRLARESFLLDWKKSSR
jgi:hypothetical protein